MSGRRAKAKRKAEGNFPKCIKEPTPLLERSYIQAPVGVNADGTLRYRSGLQVRKYLARKGIDTEALKGELEQWMKAAQAVG